MLRRDGVQIGENLRLLRIALRPLPVAQELLVEGIAVDGSLSVDAASRVAVPIPGAADVAGVIERLNVEAKVVAKFVQRIEAAEARSDNGDVKLG